MAPRKPSHARDELHVEELEDSETESRTSRSRSKPPVHPKSGGATEASLLQVLGLIGLCAGLGLWIGADLHEGVADVAASLGAVSLHPGTVAVAGLLLLACGRIRKGLVQLSRQGSGKEGDDELLEQVAAAQVHARHSVERLARTQGEIVDTLSQVQNQLKTLVSFMDQPKKDDGGQEAMFRLAASLDQLGARVEQRMQAQFETFGESLQKMGADVIEAQTTLSTLIQQLPTQTAEPSTETAEPMPELACAEEATETTDPWSEPLPEGEVSSPEEEALEEPAAAIPAQTHEPISSLGVLDTIPDEADEPPPALRSTKIGPLPEMEDLSALSGPQEDLGAGGIVKEGIHSPAERALELDTHTKLTQLSDLLTDDRLRAALEDMRRNG